MSNKKRESGQALFTTHQRGQALLTTDPNTSGQALLIVLLSMAVILTVVLSFASRSVVDIKTTTLEEDSLRAFSAAEAGIEQSLLTQTANSNTISTSPNVSYDATPITTISGSEFIYPRPLLSGEEATLWFVGHDAQNRLTCTSSGDENCTRRKRIEFCWGNGIGTTPAIEVSIFYDPTQSSFNGTNDFGAMKVARFNFDPDAARRVNNKFTEDDNTGPDCLRLNYKASATIGNVCKNAGVDVDPGQVNCLVMAKVRMLYNNQAQSIGIDFPGNPLNGNNPVLPSQGFRVQSTGVSGEVERTLNVFRSYPAPQSIFSAAVFSRNSLTKP